MLAGLCAAVGGDATVLCSDAACSEERKDEAAVAAVAPLAKVWEGTLYHPEDLRGVAFHDLFTAWRTKVEKAGTRVRGDVFPATATLPAPPAGVDAKLAAPLPTLDALGYDAADAACDGRGDFFMPAGGETAALARLRKYVFEEDRLKDYFDTRNGMIGQGYSTKLAPWLSRGCVSPRAVARACAEYERTRGIKNKSTYWVVFELTWRDYFVFYAQTYGSKLFRPYGVKDIRERTWRADPEALRRWKAGETGMPLVDANMRELLATGFMSNRGRQNVASYLVLDLGLDWRLGAEHFEEHLVDYTPEANWGNWHAAAGLSGGRVNRFNILKQSKDYDPKGDYVKLWIPELAKVPAPQCFTPSSLSEADREAAGAGDYPAPLPTQGFKFPAGARPGKNETMEVEEGENSITAAVTPQPSVEEPALEGVFTFVDGSRYEGEYVVVDGQRKRSGKGTMIQGPETSEGDWADDKLHGAGEIAFATGAKYVGAKYVGGWRDNKMHGMGCYTDTDKVNWKGQFHNGKFYNGKAYATLR